MRLSVVKPLFFNSVRTSFRRSGLLTPEESAKAAPLPYPIVRTSLSRVPHWRSVEVERSPDHLLSVVTRESRTSCNYALDRGARRSIC